MNIDKELIKIATEVNILNGKTNDQARKFVFNTLHKANTKSIYTDDYWLGPNAMLKALTQAGIDYSLKSADYGPDMKYKMWRFTISFKNNKDKETVLHGDVTAHAAGTVKDPMSRYDITCQVF